MLKVVSKLYNSVKYSTLNAGDCFTVNNVSYIKTTNGALNCTTFAVDSFNANDDVIPYTNSTLMLN